MRRISPTSRKIGTRTVSSSTMRTIGMVSLLVLAISNTCFTAASALVPRVGILNRNRPLSISKQGRRPTPTVPTRRHHVATGFPKLILCRVIQDVREFDVSPNASSSVAATSSLSQQVSSPKRWKSGDKLRRLKDRMWARETLEDITSAEFACRLGRQSDLDEEEAGGREVKGGTQENAGVGSPSLPMFRRKRAVDFENLLEKLNVRVEEMCTPQDVAEGKDCYFLDDENSLDQKLLGRSPVCYSLVEGMGMGSVVYSHEQREALLLRIMATRQNLLRAIQAENSRVWEATSTSLRSNVDAADLEVIKSQLAEGQKESIRLDDATEEKFSAAKAADKYDAPTRSISGAVSPRLYVREDGTVDWEGALQDREALQLFGAEVWARINGEDPSAFEAEEDRKELEDSVGFSDVAAAPTKQGEKSPVTAKIVETEEILKEKDTLFHLKRELEEIEAKHIALLESGISKGAAVANVNLASLDPLLRSQIRESTASLDQKQEEVSLQTLVYELERIFVYLDEEVGNTRGGYIPLQDRLNVAEFGLLESQIDSFRRQLETGDHVDSDVVAVVSDQLTDFKRRLGIDYYVTGLTLDTEGIRNWSRDIWFQIKTGVAFYVKGTRLFWSDIIFCSSLIGRALQGYTLKPREVRTLRRTFKDTVTIIPFVIILLIPLSPVGHVLVFGAIQRFFPDFFPSCFTEQRQNLLQLYESTEYTELTLNESWKDKLVRIVEAFVFAMVRTSRRIYFKSIEDDDQNGKKSG